MGKSRRTFAHGDEKELSKQNEQAMYDNNIKFGLSNIQRKGNETNTFLNDFIENNEVDVYEIKSDHTIVTIVEKKLKQLKFNNKHLGMYI